MVTHAAVKSSRLLALLLILFSTANRSRHDHGTKSFTPSRLLREKRLPKLSLYIGFQEIRTAAGKAKSFKPVESITLIKPTKTPKILIEFLMSWREDYGIAQCIGFDKTGLKIFSCFSRLKWQVMILLLPSEVQDLLQEAGIKAKEVSEYTSSPVILGEVKLFIHDHGGILKHDTEEDRRAMLGFSGIMIYSVSQPIP